jgi:hypothetical protein
VPAPRRPEIVAVEKSGEVFELEEQLRRCSSNAARTPLISAAEALPAKRCARNRALPAEQRAIALKWP